jgi:hypothetical protein
MASLILAGNTSGSVTISSPAVSGTTTLTLPTTTSTLAINGPAFSAYLGTSQTVTTGVATKLQLNTKVFDTNTNFDATTNYRFTPTIAGYYQINIELYGNASTSMSALALNLYKNGSIYQYGSLPTIAYGNAAQGITGSFLVYCNGSTDYIELYGTITGTGTCSFTAASGTINWMSGSLVRSA